MVLDVQPPAWWGSMDSSLCGSNLCHAVASYATEEWENGLQYHW